MIECEHSHKTIRGGLLALDMAETQNPASMTSEQLLVKMIDIIYLPTAQMRHNALKEIYLEVKE